MNKVMLSCILAYVLLLATFEIQMAEFRQEYASAQQQTALHQQTKSSLLNDFSIPRDSTKTKSLFLFDNKILDLKEDDYQFLKKLLYNMPSSNTEIDTIVTDLKNSSETEENLSRLCIILTKAAKQENSFLRFVDPRIDFENFFYTAPDIIFYRIPGEEDYIFAHITSQTAFYPNSDPTQVEIGASTIDQRLNLKAFLLNLTIEQL